MYPEFMEERPLQENFKILIKALRIKTFVSYWFLSSTRHLKAPSSLAETMLAVS